MASMTELIESLLWENESTTLDFKQAQYPFVGATDQEKSEILKDVLAFANTFRREDAYILLGVQDVQGGRGIILGVEDHLPDASLHEFVNRKTNRAVEFSYDALEVDGKQVGVFRIPRQARPIYLKKDYGKLHAKDVYIRQGSSTGIATPDEIARMGTDQLGASSHRPDLEVAALTALHPHARFYERVWRLIQDISQLPEHSASIQRPPSYDAAKRVLRTRFNEEYDKFRMAMSTARDVLTAKHAATDTTQQKAIAQVLAGIAEVVKTVEQFVANSTEQYASQHTNERNNARTAGEALSKLVAQRLITLGAT
jgi:Putative DNA-binding domain